MSCWYKASQNFILDVVVWRPHTFLPCWQTRVSSFSRKMTCENNVKSFQTPEKAVLFFFIMFIIFSSGLLSIRRQAERRKEELGEGWLCEELKKKKKIN
jgi:hypothetical protein